MQAPTIKIKGKEIVARKPLLGVWREIILFNRDHKEQEINFAEDFELYETMLDIYCKCFNHREVTPETVEQAMPTDEFMVKFYEATGWIGYLYLNKIAKLPEKNAGAATTN